MRPGEQEQRRHISVELFTAPGVSDEGLEAAVCTFYVKEGHGRCRKQALYPRGLTSVCGKYLG